MRAILLPVFGCAVAVGLFVPPARSADKPSQKESKPVPAFERQAPGRSVERLTPAALDAMLRKEAGLPGELDAVNDEVFLRRVTLDLVGRQPTPAEVADFLADDPEMRREAAVDRLLADVGFGQNWGNFWSDVAGYRMQEPELTFHNYTPYKQWLAEQLNAGRGWDEIVYQILTARGKVADNPAATFVAFHQANPNKLAGETTRVFLSQKIACAECHDHPFVDMPTETFHGMAAYFARVEAKIPWNDSGEIEVKSKTQGEHKISHKKKTMSPTNLAGEELDLGVGDIERRVALARWLTAGDNPDFARSVVNRIWARLLGRGFCEPVDDMGEMTDVVLPEVHAAVAEHFVATKFDMKALLRLIVLTEAYRLPAAESKADLAVRPKPLRGDEVYDSLATAIDLPNVTPPKQKPSAGIRFPVPPKSTRDLVNAAFGYDPSFPDSRIPRTRKQAMFLMNNEQVQRLINAAPESGTRLAQLLAEAPDDAAAVEQLWLRTLARQPSARERELALQHMESVGDRQAAFEDLLWSLINTAEFTTRR